MRNSHDSRIQYKFIRIPTRSSPHPPEIDPVTPMNLQTLQAELNRLERRRQTLEKRIKARTSKQYAALPARVGLKSIDELILKLLPFGSNGLRSRLSTGPRAEGGAAAAVPGKRRGRPPLRSRGT